MISKQHYIEAELMRQQAHDAARALGVWAIEAQQALIALESVNGRVRLQFDLEEAGDPAAAHAAAQPALYGLQQHLAQGPALMAAAGQAMQQAAPILDALLEGYPPEPQQEEPE